MSENAPLRPAALPAGAIWNAQTRAWELCAHGPDGTRQGECLTFRPDGTLQIRQAFAGGKPEGPFTIYHPDGGVSRSGACVAGRAEGVVSAFVGSPGSEPLRACCVPPAAVRLDSRYEAGELVQEVFFDGAGQPIRSDGQPWPARPPGVPADAEYDEPSNGWSRRWVSGQRFWSAAGVVVREVDLEGGFRRGERVYDQDGVLRESCGLDAQQRRQGPYARRFAPGQPTPYADPRIRQERGAFDTAQPVGVWSLLDEDGAILHAVDRGRAFAASPEESSPAFADDPDADAEIWSRRAKAWRAEGRVREALCAWARSAARAGDPAPLRAALAEVAAPLAPEMVAEQGDVLVRGAGVTITQILDGLVTGADPVAALRALAGVLPGASAAAAELVEAALLLAPASSGAHLTRALVRFQHGDPEGVERDAAVVDKDAPDAAAALRANLRAAFRPFVFGPDQEPLAPDPELADVGAGIIRQLSEVRWAVALYATRLQAMRKVLMAKVRGREAPAWLPPELPELLRDGAVPLRCQEVAAPPDAEDLSPVQIDETLKLQALSVPEVLAEAQADWGALGWLCWSVGLDAVAMPEALAERALMPVAMKTIVTRCWRAQDRLKTGGLLARANGVPTFTWQGTDVDALPQHVAQAVAEEYLRARAMFLWLASPDVVSPFQVDLRED